MRLIVALSGSTGPHYGVRLLEVLKEHCPEVEVHLILIRGARATIAYEMQRDPDSLLPLAHTVHDEQNVGASIASGTFVTQGMVVAPCSIKTLSAIANSYNDNLIARAADVCLKERRPLVLVVRGSPLPLRPRRWWGRPTAPGGVSLPPVPGFYHRPQTIQDLLD